LAYASGVYAHVSTPAAVSVLVPGPIPTGTQHTSGLQLPSQPSASRFRCPLHGCFCQTYPRHLGQELVRGLLKALAQGTGKTDNFSRGGRQPFRGQTNDGIPRKKTPATSPAVVISAFTTDRTEQTHRFFGTVAVKIGCLLAAGTAYPGSFVTVFFSRRYSSSTLAPTLTSMSGT